MYPNNTNKLISSPSSTISTLSPISTPSSSTSIEKPTANCYSNTTQTYKTHETRKLKRPIIYEVRTQARVRSGHQLTSRHITDLPEGSVLTVVEIRSNRVRITTPIHGWISIVSKYGTKIIMPLNVHTSKIGGTVTFPKKILNNSPKTSYVTMEGKIIDYNETYAMHKIKCRDGTHQWISLKDPTIRYISQTQSMQLQNMTRPSAVEQSQTYVSQFIAMDYPKIDLNKSAKVKKMPCANDNEFAEKIREIEKRIIEHLHVRGYYEDNPNFWRYIKKAKELAIVRAEKELLQRDKLAFVQQTIVRNN